MLTFESLEITKVKAWKPLGLVLLLFCSVSLQAQFSILQFEGFFNEISHRGFLLNNRGVTCDSLKLRTWQNKAPGEGEVICYVGDYNSTTDFVFYEKEGTSLCMDAKGELYATDVGKPGKKFYLKQNILQRAGRKPNIVLETDDSSPDSLRINLVPLEFYRLGTRKHKGMQTLAINFEEFIYLTKGKLAPAVLAEIASRIQIFPEDGISLDSILIVIPVHLANVPGDFSFIIYDLKGNVIKMYTGIRQAEFVLLKENLANGTYNFKIFFDNTVEVKNGRFHFKPVPRPE